MSKSGWPGEIGKYHPVGDESPRVEGMDDKVAAQFDRIRDVEDELRNQRKKEVDKDHALLMDEFETLRRLVSRLGRQSEGAQEGSDSDDMQSVAEDFSDSEAEETAVVPAGAGSDSDEEVPTYRVARPLKTVYTHFLHDLRDGIMAPNGSVTRVLAFDSPKAIDLLPVTIRLFGEALIKNMPATRQTQRRLLEELEAVMQVFQNQISRSMQAAPGMNGKRTPSLRKRAVA